MNDSGRCSSAYWLRLATSDTGGCPAAPGGFWPLFAADAAALEELCSFETRICCLQALRETEPGLDQAERRGCSAKAGLSFPCGMGISGLVAAYRASADTVGLLGNSVQEAANSCSFLHNVDRSIYSQLRLHCTRVVVDWRSSELQNIIIFDVRIRHILVEVREFFAIMIKSGESGIYTKLKVSKCFE